MVLTERDIRAIDFVRDFVLVSLSQLAVAIYDCGKSCEDIARRRLRILTKHHYLNRLRIGQNSEYVYYIGRRPQTRLILHQLKLVDVYCALLKLGGNIELWQNAPDWGALHPDAFFIYENNGNKFYFTVKIIFHSNTFSQKLYETEIGKQKSIDSPSFEFSPRVLLISDFTLEINPSKIKYIVIPCNLVGIENILIEE